MLNSIPRDLRYALRQMRAAPVFTAVAVLTLAVGIGAVSAVYSVVYAVLLRPLPFPHPEQLVSLHESAVGDNHPLRMSAPDVLVFERDFNEGNGGAFSVVGGYVGAGFEATGAGAPFAARAERITASLLPTLGVEPLLGRNFTQAEDAGSAPVLLLSYATWRERFHADPAVLGRTLDLDRRPYTIIGVMPRSFEFPLDGGGLSHRDLWVPMSLTPVEKASEGDNFDYSAVARLRPGVTRAAAQAEVDRVMDSIQATFPPNAGLRLHGTIVPLRDEVVAGARSLLHVLLGAVVLLLLITCVNLATLLLVRAAGRRREFGVRLALGVNRRRLVQQLLTESCALSLLGGAAGVTLAVLLVKVAPTLLPETLPRLQELGVSWPMLVAAGLLVGATGVLCGLAPALASMGTDVLRALGDGGARAGRGRTGQRLRGLLVTVQVGLATLLLVAAGLLLRSFAQMLAVNPGFQPTGMLTASISLPGRAYSTQERADAFLSTLRERLARYPGVHAVGFSTNIPLVGQRSGRLIAPEGYVKQPGEGWSIASNYLVLGDYFAAAHIPLLRGRYFSAADERPGAPLVTIISQSLAEQYFHGLNPVGMHIKTGPSFDSKMPATTIVGVVGDVKQGALDEATVPQMYEPVTQAAADLGAYSAMIGVVGGFQIVVRTAGDPASLRPALERAVHALDPLLALTEVRTMDEVLDATAAPRRFNTIAVTAFAAIALLLSLLGLYGVLAYSVTERTHEIAVRMALGATRADVLLRTLWYALRLASWGVTSGVIAVLLGAHLLRSLLFGVRPLDGWAIGGAAAALLLCTTLAGLIPARRAAALEPVEALRAE